MTEFTQNGNSAWLIRILELSVPTLGLHLYPAVFPESDKYFFDFHYIRLLSDRITVNSLEPIDAGALKRLNPRL
jgi:hypothetical protein